MDFAEWQAGFARSPRADESWATRTQLYAYLAGHDNPGAVQPSRLVAEVHGVAKTSFYKHFGSSSERRLVPDLAGLHLALAETREWTYQPYREGLEAMFDRLRPSARARLDATVRTVSTWAQDHRALAQGGPPPGVQSDLEEALEELAAAAAGESAAELARECVDKALQDESESSLAVLNRLRPRMETIIGGRGTAAVDAAEASVVESIAAYADALLSHAGQGAAHDRLDPLLTRLRRLADAAP